MEENNRKIIVVLPSFEPGEKFPTYLQSLIDVGLTDILVVDDGSDSIYQPRFDEAKQLGCEVFRLGVNCGKGRALKMAFNYILVSRPEVDVIVTADHDGTYLAEDVKHAAEEAEENTMTLGCRDFKDPNIASNRQSNAFTSFFLRVLGEISLSDTQTGLRAYTRDLLPYLMTVPGERYDYDFNLIVNKKTIAIKEVPITATRRVDTKSTHFHPLADSWILIRSFLAFVLTSLTSTIVDVTIYTMLISLLAHSMPVMYITVATIFARVFSNTLVYIMDKYVVFKAGDHAHMGRYLVLAVVKIALSSLLVTLFVLLTHNGETIIKMLVDLLLFFLGYRIEKNWVYADD